MFSLQRAAQAQGALARPVVAVLSRSFAAAAGTPPRGMPQPGSRQRVTVPRSASSSASAAFAGAAAATRLKLQQQPQSAQQAQQQQQQKPAASSFYDPMLTHQQQQQQHQQQPSAAALDAVAADYDRASSHTLSRAQMSPGTALDIEKLFAASRLHRSFDAPPAGPSFFARMQPKQPLHFAGSRRLIDPAGNTVASHPLFLVRTVDPALLAIVDTLTALDYEREEATQHVVSTIVARDGTRANVVDVDEESGTVKSRTLVRLRGEPWQWHSAVSLCQLDQSASNAVDAGAGRPLHEGTTIVGRLRFGEAGMLAEKFLLHAGACAMTIVDELRVVDAAAYDAKVRALYRALMPDAHEGTAAAAGAEDPGAALASHFSADMSEAQAEAKLRELGLAAPHASSRGKK